MRGGRLQEVVAKGGSTVLVSTNLGFSQILFCLLSILLELDK